MKSYLTRALAAAMTVISLASSAAISSSVHAGSDEEKSMIVHYDFELVTENTVKNTVGDDLNAELRGNASVKHNAELDSDVLYLSGSNAYLELPRGLFDGMKYVTVSMDIYSMMDNGNFFTFAVGKDSNKYLFLRTRSTEFRYAITKNSWNSESDVAASGQFMNKWVNVTLTISDKTMKLYIDGELADTQTSLPATLADFGSDIIAYIGKSFYDGDAYFKGCIDNVKIFDQALTELEIANMLGVKTAPFKKVFVENATTITSTVDKEAQTVDVYVSRAALTADKNASLNSATIVFSTQKNCKIKNEGDIVTEYETPTSVTFTSDSGEETWTVTPHLASNPVIDGQFADPDIDVFGDTYYLYTTSDGYAGWSGTRFRVFSSKNLVDWKDEGVILNCEKGKDVKWAVGSAWAPSIEEKNGKYYFYFCAKDTSGNSNIGVAVASSPTGPFVAEDEPLMTVAICKKYGVSMGQAIDPSIFTDDDGTSYMLFGNGNAAVVKLNDDMISCDLSTLKNYTGVTDFREAITVTKRDGLYHFTWSCDDTGSANYHVNYGTSKKIDGAIQYRGTILEKNAELDILGTGHHSILQIPGEDEYYIAYHRFYTPLGTFTDGTGHHRQTCIDVLTFGENGLMEKVTPTLTGVEKRYLSEEAEAADKASDTEENIIPKDTAAETEENTAPDTNEEKGCGGAMSFASLPLVSALGASLMNIKTKKKKKH